MKRTLLKTLALVLVLALTASLFIGCGKQPDPTEPSNNPTDPTTPTSGFDAATAMSGFATAVEGTVKLTYVTNYKVDVVRPGADASGMDSFKRDVVATAVIEMDLGADLYIKVTKTRQDKLIEDAAVKTEEILYKKDGKYFYQTSSAGAVEVTDAAAKLAEIFETATYEQIGGLTLDALIYNSTDKAYELKTFGLSDTFIEMDLVDPTYAEGANGGIVVNYKPEYIGYRTDGGWSDFSNKDSGYAAEIEILTDNKGYVTSMKENYNQASLVFNIMSNPPTVTITGERSFTATYGEAITKSESVDFAASTAVLEEAFGGSYVVMTCAMGDFANLVPVANGGALEMGKLICVKPTANEGYEVVKVIVNGNETPITDPAMAGGFYCFNVAPGNNTIEVMFKESEPTMGIVTVDNKTSYAYQLQSFTYAGAPSDYKVIENGEIEPGAAIFGAIVIDSTKEVTVYVNGVETTVNIPAGPSTFYCFSVKTGGKYEVVITEKGAANPGMGIVTVDNQTGYDYQLQSFTYAGAPSDYKVIENGEIEPGAAIFGAIVIDSTKEVTVTVNGAETTVNIPAGGVTFYCFSVKEGGNYDVVITEKGAAASNVGIVTVTNNTGYAYELQSFTYAGAPTDYKVITNGQIEAGAAIFGAIVISSETPVVVVVNGAETTVNIPAGGVTFYCFAVKEGGEFIVEINPAA